MKGQNFNLWPFWCPLRKKLIQYLIWKLSLVVRNHKVGKGVAALLHSTTISWKLSIYVLHKEADERFWESIAVSLHRVSVVGPNKYYSRKIKCCKWLNDQICNIIYGALVRFQILQVLSINETCKSRTFCSKFQIFLN